MSAVDEAAEINRLSVKPAWREEIDAVVPLTEPTRKFRYGHDFKASDTEFGESRQLSRSRLPTSLGGKGAE
jgi:hypothetical protein